jgi:hypothetical protein
VAKDKKKKKKDKKDSKGQSAGIFSPKTAKRLQEISSNPLVADVVAATLIGAASALRDSKKAHQLAATARNELEELAHRGAKNGNALWQLALDVGRKSLETLAGEIGGQTAKSKPRGSTKAAASKSPKKKAAATPKRNKSTGKSSRSPAKRPSGKLATR